jgi:hypothetical protein
MRRGITVNLLTVLRVVKEQLQAVKDLRKLFENAQGYQQESFLKNTIIIPVWKSEHIELILKALEWVISERQSYLQKFEDMKKVCLLSFPRRSVAGLTRFSVPGLWHRYRHPIAGKSPR